MKKIVVLLLGFGAALQLEAQVFNHESLTGAAFGGLTGAIIGHNSGGHGGEGAAIGAGVGFLLGSLAHQSRVDRGYYGPQYPYSRPNYVSYSGPTLAYSHPAAAQPSQQVTVINNNNPPAPSPMSGANALFGR